MSGHGGEAYVNVYGHAARTKHQFALKGAAGSIDSSKLVAFMAQLGPHPYKEE